MPPVKEPMAASLVAFLLLFIVLQPMRVGASNGGPVTINVYADGTALVRQSVTADPGDVSVSLQLLSSVITNPVVFDQNGSSLYFQIAGTNITVYTVGATRATLEYATGAITSKQGTVWTLAFTAYYNTTVVLPDLSTLNSVSGTPVSLARQNGSPVVVVSAGRWTIDYGVPVHVASTSISNTTSATSGGSTTTGPVGASGKQPDWVFDAALGLIVAVVAATAILLVRRRSISDVSGAALREDDAKVLAFIAEKGGKALEFEVRTKFALPKTTAWRQIKRLERTGYVRINKLGSQNQIELVKKP